MRTKQEWETALLGFDLETATLKRIAWAYGCAEKGSDDEKRWLAVLVERIQGGEK